MQDTAGVFAAVGLLTIIAAVTKLTSLVKAAKNKNWNGVVTPLVAIALAFGLLFAVANSQFVMPVPGLAITIQDADVGTLVVLSVIVGLTAAFGKDWLNARDNTASQAELPLIDWSGPPKTPG